MVESSLFRYAKDTFLNHLDGGIIKDGKVDTTSPIYDEFYKNLEILQIASRSINAKDRWVNDTVATEDPPEEISKTIDGLYEDIKNKSFENNKDFDDETTSIVASAFGLASALYDEPSHIVYR